MSVAPASATKMPILSISDDPDRKIIAMWLAEHHRPRRAPTCWRGNFWPAPPAAWKCAPCGWRASGFFMRSLRDMKASSQMTFISHIQALFAFAGKIGYLADNPAQLIKRPQCANDLTERIVDEAEKFGGSGRRPAARVMRPCFAWPMSPACGLRRFLRCNGNACAPRRRRRSERHRQGP